MQSHYIEVAQGGVSMVEQYTIDCECLAYTLVTQPMLQRQPNCTELRLMDSYIQILCKDDFLVQGSDGEGTFGLHFRNLHKIWT